MSKKVGVPDHQIEIRYKGVYDYDGLYKLIRSWLDERRYDFMETKYKDKVSGPFGNEVEINMDPELKVDEFVKFHIKVRTHFWDVKEFEAELHGKKRPVCKGKFWIRLTGEVELDWQNKFKNYGKLLDWLINHILRRYYEVKYYDVLTYDLFNLETEIKKFLRMETSHNAY